MTAAVQLLRLQGLLEELASLPRCPVDLVALILRTPSDSPSEEFSDGASNDLSQLCSPCMPSATDVSVVGMPTHTSISAKELTFRLHVPAPLSTTEADIVLRGLAQHISVDASLKSCTLPIELCADLDSLSVVVRALLPLALDSGSEVQIRDVRVAGARVLMPYPILVSIVAGMMPPLELPTPSLSFIGEGPAISRSGRLFVPQGASSDERGGPLCIFEPNGTAVPSIVEPSASAVAVCDDTDTLVLSCRTSRQVVALSLSTLQPRWSTDEASSDMMGAAILPSASPTPAVAVTAFSKKRLQCYALADGRLLSSVDVDDCPVSIAAATSACGSDSACSVFVAIQSSSRAMPVLTFLWQGGKLVYLSEAPNPASFSRLRNYRLLAVMPPAPGKLRSHLLIGTWGTSELLVVALPKYTHVHTHKLQGMSVSGIAADPCGTALAVCDRNGFKTRVLSWPIDGMPELE
jgi:hypothetical protein